MAHKLSDVAVNAQAIAFAGLFSAGFLRIYDGKRPGNANIGTNSQKVLAELRFGDPAFLMPSPGVLDATDIAKEKKAKETGKPSWFRCFASDGRTALMDGAVGPLGSGCEIELPVAQDQWEKFAIQKNMEISISRFTYTVTE